MNFPDKYGQLLDAIESGDVQAGITEAQQLVAAGQDLRAIYAQAVTPCMKDIGERFSRLELYLPDMMRAAEVVKGIHAALEGTLKAEEKVAHAGRIVIGTVNGDIHDIGKNIVASMLEVNGFEVVDVGVDVEAYAFIQKAREVEADIIAMSSLLSTSLPYVADLIEMVRSNAADAARFKIMIGGGPVTADYAAKIGADAYGEDAADAVRQALSLCQVPENTA